MKKVKLAFGLVLMLVTCIANAQNNVLNGDINGDGEITLHDAKNIALVVMYPEYMSHFHGSADANRDGKVSMADVVYTLNYLNNPVKGIHEGHEYMDLGLSVKWATCNVGAEKPEECGDYFAWGETEPKQCYNWGTYKWMQAGRGSWQYVTKYTVPDHQTSAIWYKNSTFIGDKKKILDAEDDAAHVNWGGKWRMPTAAELSELLTRCKWIWTSKNGMNGYEVVGPNGNHIFLPATGFYENDELFSVGDYADYWSSTLSEDDSNDAFYVYFHPTYVDWYYYSRYYGQSVRAVFK